MCRAAGRRLEPVPARAGRHHESDATRQTWLTPARDPHLAHHFDTPRQQYESSKTGMWLFLSTEILLFSGLFCAYAVYRANHPDVFIYAHQFLDKRLGGLNTLVLIFSSLTAAWAVRAAQLNQRRLLIGLFDHDPGLRLRVPGHQGDRVQPEVEARAALGKASTNRGMSSCGRTRSRRRRRRRWACR